MAIIGMLIGLPLGLLATGFIVSFLLKFAQLLFLIVTRVAVSIFYNVVILISLLVAFGMVSIFDKETPFWLLLLAPILGIGCALAFLDCLVKEVTGIFSLNHKDRKNAN